MIIGDHQIIVFLVCVRSHMTRLRRMTDDSSNSVEQNGDILDILERARHPVVLATLLFLALCASTASFQSGELWIQCLTR